MQWIFSKPVNILAFNLIWIACVVGREQYFWLVAPLALTYVSLVVAKGIAKPYQIALPALIGLSADGLLTLFGFFQFQYATFLLPAWLVILWIGFATSLNMSLEFLGKNKFVAAAAGALAFPFNYSVGERLGAVSFGDNYMLVLIVLSAIWAIGLPLLFAICEGALEKTNETV